MKIFKVGGCVRDHLLNLPISDTDYVVVNSSVQEMYTLGFIQVGKDFPVFLHPETKDEYALARTERKSGTGYNGFICNTENVTLEEDLFRRDITINSIAMGSDGNFIDPFNGQKDIKDKILRPTSKAFKEDPLRVIRLARFKARFGEEWSFADTAYKYALDVKNELKFLTKERLYKETKKSFQTSKPSVFFRALLDLGVLDVVFPELFEMKDHVFNHTMLALDFCNTDESRWSILFHNVSSQIPKEKYSLSREEFETCDFVSKNHQRFNMMFEGKMNATEMLDVLLSVKTKDRLLHILDSVIAVMCDRNCLKYTQHDIIWLYQELKNHRTDCTGLSVEQIKAKVRNEKLKIVKDFVKGD